MFTLQNFPNFSKEISRLTKTSEKDYCVILLSDASQRYIFYLSGVVDAWDLLGLESWDLDGGDDWSGDGVGEGSSVSGVGESGIATEEDLGVGLTLPQVGAGHGHVGSVHAGGCKSKGAIIFC